MPVHSAIDVRRFPWIRPLVSAYTTDFASVASLFAGDPGDPGAWRDVIARVTRARRDRTALAALIEAQVVRRHAPAAARDAAQRFRDPSAVAIVTGQQAGLFGGPLYTILKAVTAIQLARTVTRDHGVPAVPVFWVDEEDHDFDEVRGCRVLDADLQLRTIALGDLDGSGAHPVASLKLDAGVEDTLTALRTALPPTEFTADLIARLAGRYAPGAGLSRAFAGWLDDLLGAQGLVVFEAGDPAAKPLVADLFARELDHPGRTAELVLAAGEAMTALGHAPQVTPAKDSIALHYMTADGRHAVKNSSAEMKKEVREHPERFSPNVLLRPLVQDRIFPTACYVAGPAELAYQGQLKSVYAEFGVEPPLLYSRSNATIVDGGAMRFLDRYHVPLEALQPQDESALNHLLESQLPPAIDRALAEADAHVAADLAALKEAIPAVDPTLAGAADTTLDHIRETLRTLHTKIVRASKKKDETVRRQFHRARALAFPGGEPQERTLSVTFFLNRYGPSLCDRLLEDLPLDTSKHYVLTL